MKNISQEYRSQGPVLNPIFTKIKTTTLKPDIHNSLVAVSDVVFLPKLTFSKYLNLYVEDIDKFILDIEEDDIRG
jgi:hypothetical protein